jgi:sugar phosphate isomerase/epimerase
VPALAKKLKLKIASVGSHHLTMTPKKWRVAGAMQLMKQSIDLAAKIGAPTVATYIAGYYNPPTYILMTPEEAKSLFVKMIKELADYAEDKGVTLSIEPHEGTIINTPEITLELMERINSKNVFITIDFGGIEIGMKAHKSVEELIGQFKGLVNHVHCKDVTGAPGNWNMCWFGGGQVNFQRYADALRKINYKGYICVEWEGWFKGGLEGVGETYGQGLADFDRAAPEAREFLKKYFD